MHRVAHETSVRRPREDVFRLLTDFDAMPQWLPGLREAEVLSEGPLAVGGLVMQRKRMLGRVSTLALTVVDHAPPERVAFYLARDAERLGLLTWTLHETDGGATRVEATLEFRLPGFVTLFLPLVKARLAAELAADVDALKARAESKP